MRDAIALFDKLTVARDLIASDPLDLDTALLFLDDVAMLLGAAAFADLAQAKAAVGAVPSGDGRHQAVARYAIARLVVLLERAAKSL